MFFSYVFPNACIDEIIEKNMRHKIMLVFFGVLVNFNDLGSITTMTRLDVLDEKRIFPEWNEANVQKSTVWKVCKIEYLVSVLFGLSRMKYNDT